MSTENKTPERELTEVQKLLDQPITSRDRLKEVIATLEGHNIWIDSPDVTSHHINYNKDDATRLARVRDIGYLSDERTSSSGDAWWLLREWVREKVGLYPEATSVLTQLRGAQGLAGHYWPHISKSDPTMVAFTPDHTAGVNDRQVKTTIGKVLRRFLPLLSDEQVSLLEAQHRAELVDEFLVAESIEEVERIYTTMAGDSGCMRHKKANWDFTDYHPSAVYARPQDGVRVAYLENGRGVPIARTVIYDNPDNPDDKRYVRLYGAHTRLEAILKRKGYKVGGLLGAKLNALIDSRFKHSSYASTSWSFYVMPYLDSPAGGTSTAFKGTDVYKQEGEDFLRVIDRNTTSKLLTIGENLWGDNSYVYAGGQGTGGHVCLRDIPTEGHTFTCAISGEEYSAMDVARVQWFSDEGKIVHVAATNVPAYTKRVKVLAEDGSLVVVQTTRENPSTIYAGVFGWLHNTPEVFEACGVNMLSTKHYPDYYRDGVPTEYAYTTVSRVRETLDGETIMRSDAVELFDVTEDGDEVTTYVHSSEVRKLGKRGFVSTPVKGGERKWIKKGHSLHVTTSRGRDAIQGVHDLTKLSNGKWEFTRNAEDFQVSSLTFAHDKETSVLDAEFDTAVLRNTFHWSVTHNLRNAATDTTGARNHEEVLASSLMPNLRVGSRWSVAVSLRDDGTLVALSRYGQVTAELYRRTVAAARLVLASDAARLTELGFDTAATQGGLRLWARLVVATDTAARETIADVERSEAEARARVMAEDEALTVQLTRDERFAAAA